MNVNHVGVAHIKIIQKEMEHSSNEWKLKGCGLFCNMSAFLGTLTSKRKHWTANPETFRVRREIDENQTKLTFNPR